MKPILKSIPVSQPIIKETIGMDDVVISRALVEDTEKINNVIEPPYSPTALKNLRYSSIYHRKCLKAKAVDVVMTGHTIKTEQDQQPNEILTALFNDYSFETSFFKAMEDFNTYGWAGVEIARNKAWDIAGWKYLRSSTIRMMKDGERVIQRVGASTIYFKVAGKRVDDDLNYKTGEWMNAESNMEDRATEVLWIGGESQDSDFYDEPDYLSALLTILSDEYLREYNNNGFITNGIPNYFITITGNFDEEEDEDGKTFEDYIEEQLLDLQNKPGTAVVFTIPTADAEGKIDVTVTKISDEMKEASFEKFRESNMNEILAAHEVPPSRLGIVYNGALGGSVDEERNRLYADKTVRPLQRKLEQLINTVVVKTLLEIENQFIEFTPLDTRNIKEELEIAKELFNMAAMKPAEIRDTFKDIFNLVMDVEDTPIIDYNPELDEFYLNGQPLNLEGNDEAMGVVDGIVKSIDNGIQELITS